jgi:hypothetical protein
MSVQAAAWVIEHSRHKGANLLCLLMIANHAHADGTGAYPSIATLARECRMSERQIKRIIPLLEKSGELTVAPDKGKRGAHLYTLPLMPHGDKMSPTLRDKMSPREQPRGQDVTTARGQVVHALGDISDALGDIAMSPEPSLEPSKRIKEIPPVTSVTSPKGVKRTTTKIPDDFEVTDHLREQAIGYGVPSEQIAFETEKWRDHHAAKGDVVKDADASWRYWMRGYKNFNRGSPNGQYKTAGEKNDDRVMRLLKGEYGGRGTAGSSGTPRSDVSPDNRR